MSEAHASTSIAPRQARPIDTLRGLLERSRESMAMVLPRHLTPERMIKVALVAASRTPALLQCDPKSVVQSVMSAAQLGLDCSGTLGSAYLVPYGRTCQLIVGYRGLIDLARRSGQISSIEAHCVRANDAYEVEYGLNPVLRHKPCLSGDPGEVVLVYAIARLVDGTIQTEVMTRAEVDAIRERSKAGRSGPWVTDYAEMARKTVVRRLCKYLPLSVELQDALALDDQVETGGPVAIDVSAAEDDPPPRRTRRLAAQVKAEQEPEREDVEALPDMSDHIHDQDDEQQLELTPEA